MRALHSAERKGDLAPNGEKKLGRCGRRVISLLLCFCMTIPMLFSLGEFSPLSEEPTKPVNATKHVQNRVADPDTMDSYVGKLLSEDWGSRYAGRVWTDKSVFAYTADKENIITLDMKTDGYDGKVGYNADFGHVFSALASSQVEHEAVTSPLDLVILLDMSGSMGTDVVDGQEHNDGSDDTGLRVKHSRIKQVLNSINKAIDYLMSLNDTNRVCVVGYGGTAFTLLPLDHYTTTNKESENGETWQVYLSVENFTYYDGAAVTKSGSSAYTVHALATGTKNNLVDRRARNDYATSTRVQNRDKLKLIGFNTNMQAGIWQGFNELYDNIQSVEDVTYTYTSKLNNEKITVARIPLAFVMTDGGSNYTVKAGTSGTSGDGNEWYNLTVPEQLNTSSKYDDPTRKKYRVEAPNGTGGDAVILDILLTASYMKSKIQNKYTELLQDAKILDKEKGEKADFQIHSISVDAKSVAATGPYQIPRIYAGLDPKDFFRSAAELKAVEGIDTDPATWTYKGSVTSAYDHFTQWKANASGTTISFSDSDGKSVNIKFNKLPADHSGVTNADVIENILYNDSFADIGASDLAETFRNLIDRFDVPVFSPISGDNDAGVGNSITYQDPLGEYMEIKNSSITTTPHHIGDETIGASGEQTYDMAMLVFGEMHGLVRAGVYDYQWNNAWMKKYEGKPDPTNPKVTITPDKTPFPQGWYKGSPEEAADAPLSGTYLTTDLAGTWPNQDPVTGKKYNNAQEARDDGWVMRFNFSTLLSFVPIAGAPDDNLPSNLSEQEKNTVYTCYRFAGSQEDRNALHINPIYGSTVPKTILDEWQKYYDTHGSYPVDDSIYAKEPGVYRLSDIRVWIEDTGDYVDSDGAITPNTGYDRSLYLNIPTAAVPTQLATITISDDEVLSYQTNLPEDHVGDPNYNNYCYQSTPLRLFYAVGVEEELILRDAAGNQNGVDFTKVSPEYIAAHSVVNQASGEQQNYVWFISNYYSNTTYGDYVADMTTAPRTRGDPTVTFSPSEDNRYYVFQKPLPLYAHAYRVQADRTLKPVDKSDEENWGDNKSGNGGTHWEGVENNVTGGGSWTGGEFIGTYKDEEAFKTAYSNMMNAATGGDQKHITDDDGNTHLYQSNGIVFLEDDLMDRVTSDASGYTSDSISFSSDDYYFILLEYYLPTEGIGTNLQGDEVAGSTNARKVQHVLARKGSEFGSGFVSNEIDNGGMLCWTDMKGHVTDAFKYLSKSETGDPSRGEPTWEKLTKTRDDLKEYLTGTYGIQAEDTVPNPDYDPTKGESADNKKEINVLDYLADYWLAIRNNEQVKAALDAANTNGGTLSLNEFNAYFQFAVATRPGGIRTGDMSSNIQTKGETYDPATQLYKDNKTKTSNTYYLPTISENSGTDNNVIINNYLGNNGYLEIANQMLHVTKTLEAPEGFALTDAAEREKFNYQLYVQGVSGKRSAILTEYNEYAKVWERKLAYIDVLTDNSDLVQDNNSTRALFIVDTFMGSAGDTMTAKQVIANGTDADGNTIYYEANEDGTLTIKDDGSVDTKVNPMVDPREPLYYLYLPPIETTLETTQHVRRLYQNVNYDGTADGYPEGTNFVKNGTTTYYSEGHRDDTGTESGSGNNTSFREATGTRPAGTITYWAQDAELIPVTEVHAAEATNSIASGDPAAYALMAVGGGTTYETDAESSTPGVWTHSEHMTEHEKNHVNLTYDTFVIRKPSGETSMTAFESPFLTRTQYMTTELNFGVNANDDGSGEKGNPLTKNDLYDQIIPSADRPDLFGSVTLDDIAANTAEFTLRHNEGLLLSGLDNRVVYRFTEKLTDEQMKKGYTLKQISHVQQRGSDTVYMPGVQEIPVYKNSDGTITWAIGSDGEENSAAQKGFEPFAHTNAILWESYATMAAGASGNHHQPEEGEPAKNPSCEDAGDKANLDVGRCDLAQTDGTTRHYFYYGGKLVDPHYEGEAAGMSRYVLNPTAHFGLTDETVFGTNPDNGYYEYNGVYSVYGTTGWFEEQAHYINTVSPEMLVLTKKIVDKTGKDVENLPEREFTFTITLTEAGTQAIKNSGGLYYWKGDENFTNGLTWTDKTTGTTYNMPSSAPKLDEYQNHILPAKPTGEAGKTYLAPLELVTEGDKTYYVVHLKANETVVIYGLVSDMGYTIEETPDAQYPAVGGEEHTETGEGYFTQSGTVVHDLSEAKSMFPKATSNRTDFYNQLPDGELTIGKKILDSDAETVTQKFTFEVTLTPLDSDEGLTATKYDKNGEKVDGFTLKWDNTTDGGKVATFELQHGETVVIGGIPLDTKYTVKETKRDGYNLQHVADNKEDKPDEDEKYLELTNGGIEGTVTAENPRAFLLFANGKAVAPPFTGGIGASEIVLGGVLLIGLSVALFLYGRHRKRRVI